MTFSPCFKANPLWLHVAVPVAVPLPPLLLDQATLDIVPPVTEADPDIVALPDEVLHEYSLSPESVQLPPTIFNLVTGAVVPLLDQSMGPIIGFPAASLLLGVSVVA